MTTGHGAAAREYIPVGEQPPTLKKIDWRTAPVPFKLYRGGHRLTLPAVLGQVLRDMYGVTSYRWTAPDAFTRIMGLSGTILGQRFTGSVLRPVPSGGALYPSELYLVARTGAGIPPGVYHYDPAHHLLDVLAYGGQEGELAEALAPAAAPLGSLVVLLTTFFWKNAFKYGDFGYRLGCLDAGVLLGQVLEVARSHGLDTHVHYRFLDARLEELLGLDGLQESVYAAVSLAGPAPEPLPEAADGAQDGRTARAVAPRVPGHWSVESMELPARLHHASRLEVLRGQSPPAGVAEVLPPAARSLPLADSSVDLADGIGRRRSALGTFAATALTGEQLSSLVRAALGGYSSDLCGSAAGILHTALFCAVAGAGGLERGIYYADPEHGTLRQVRSADIRAELQQTLVLNIFNLAGSGACFVPVGSYGTGFEAWGDRWYRIQNLEAGILIQRLHLAAAALRLGCRVNCGYHTDKMDRLLALDGQAATALAQVMIGAQADPGHCYDAALDRSPGGRPR